MWLILQQLPEIGPGHEDAVMSNITVFGKPVIMALMFTILFSLEGAFISTI